MSEEINPAPLTPQQQETENAASTTFRPAPPQMNRDTLMYAAGMAAGKRAAARQLLPWKVAAAFLICTTTTFALWHSERVVYLDRPELSRVVPAANISIPVPDPSISAASVYFPDGDSYLQTRQRILVLGLNALPSLPESSAPRAPSPPAHPRSDSLDAAPAWQRRRLHRRPLMNPIIRFRHLLLAAAILPGLAALAQNPAPGTPQATKISVSAAPVEKPALSYVLLPEAQDIQPGNAAVKYGMAINLYLSYRLNGNPDANEDETLDKLNDAPLAQLDVEAARKILDPMRSTLKLLREGARCESCAWQLNIRQDGMATLLPYLTPMRAQTRRLQLAIRVDIKNHQWSDAQDKLQTGYAVARHLAHGQTLIETLVGAAVAIQMNACVKDWISEPGSPNLFWPLADLPHPIVPLGPGITYERSLVFSEFPEWRSLMRGEGTPEQLTDFLHHFFRVVSGVDGGPPVANNADVAFKTSQFYGVAMAIVDYPQAKQFLIAHGATPEDVAKCAVASVVGEFFTRSFKETADDTFKWMLLPPEQAIPGLLQTEKEVSELPGDSFPHLLARTIVPALSRAVVSTGKPDRQLAAFRIVEALRDYAAQNHALPDSLDQLSLPLSGDPTLGKPFTYEHRGDTAVLTSPAPPLPGSRDQIHYEITLQSQ